MLLVSSSDAYDRATKFTDLRSWLHWAAVAHLARGDGPSEAQVPRDEQHIRGMGCAYCLCQKNLKKYSTPTRNHTIHINKDSDARDKSCAKRGKLVIYKEEEEKNTC